MIVLTAVPLSNMARLRAALSADDQIITGRTARHALTTGIGLGGVDLAIIDPASCADRQLDHRPPQPFDTLVRHGVPVIVYVAAAEYVLRSIGSDQEQQTL